MKKKTFYQSNILWQILCLFILLIAVSGVYAIYYFINKLCYIGVGDTFVVILWNIIQCILLLLGIIYCIYTFIRLEHNNIHLTNEKIYMNDDWLNKREKIQHYSEVNFSDIKSIDIIWTEKNSKGNLIKSWLMSAVIEKPYLSITNKKGEVINFFVMYIAKKDVIKLINEIGIRMKNVGNNIEIISNDEALLKINKQIKTDI